MRHTKRVSTNPVDRVAGVTYLLNCAMYLPVYDAAQSEEDGWEMLVNAMADPSKAHLFFLYSEPGNGKTHWRPSWEQVMTKTIQPGDLDWWIRVYGPTEEIDADFYIGCHIDSGDVRGLADASIGDEDRRGELIVKDHFGTPHTFGIIAKHQYPIPEGSYTLLGSWSSTVIRSEDHWVVGSLKQDGKFQKISVFEMECHEGYRLAELGVAKDKAVTILC
ncbi:hypothetical protein DFS33DRAFT_1353766 [Desarmillaria ectypa]|nr:hypothetical protein DFS33DRAFT_1353766 [Desarmillaria ectypa]